MILRYFRVQSNLTLRTFLVTTILVLKVKLFLSWWFLKLIWSGWSLVIWFLKPRWFLSWQFLKSSSNVLSNYFGTRNTANDCKQAVNICSVEFFKCLKILQLYLLFDRIDNCCPDNTQDSEVSSPNNNSVITEMVVPIESTETTKPKSKFGFKFLRFFGSTRNKKGSNFNNQHDRDR